MRRTDSQERLSHVAGSGQARPLNGTARRSGLTLVELLVASAIMVLIVGALGVLAKAVQMGAQYSGGHGEAIQHARVTLERITRIANEATTSQTFPGILTLATTAGGNSYPDTLVVWHPDDAPADPARLTPRFNELVIFCASLEQPNELIQLTAPGDTRPVPEYTDQSVWRAAVESLRQSDVTRQIVMTNLVRTASADGSGLPSSLRPCVRFNVRLRPSETQLTAYENGTYSNDEAKEEAWKEIPWVQNIYSPSLGLRQVWLRIELQLTPGDAAQENATGEETAIPFLDSATVYYSVNKAN
ncbi:MAG TPA: prepilin-type N-terminal cleavage/methylation domain-containing protein [Thermoguttaceae bacterium]|nr:prepilin-type N-terminal cleavage/methylation domain-containing protein [Thermoguttaceae bacterium]